jgi:dihydroorotate dehydrogenase
MGPDELGVRMLRDAYRHAANNVLFRFDPEAIHEWTLRALAAVPGPVLPVGRTLFGAWRAPVRVAGIDFPGRVGVAAGLDKDGRAARAWSALGFGFMELGTVTPRPQPGNPAPRLFRLRASHAIVNSMGFNNAGAPALAARLARVGVGRGNGALGAAGGVSIGKNQAPPLPRAVDDYLTCADVLAPYADYLAVNVSSPNTPGLRDLQAGAELETLVGALTRRVHELDPDRPVPVFVKVAPDLTDAGLDAVLAACEAGGAAGIVATNTTVVRDGLAAADMSLASQGGGLSGAPLTRRAREAVRRVAALTRLPVIGSGGIMTPADASAMLDAGAVLVQVFTGFVYSGPALVAGVNRVAKTRRGTPSAADRRRSARDLSRSWDRVSPPGPGCDDEVPTPAKVSRA